MEDGLDNEVQKGQQQLNGLATVIGALEKATHTRHLPGDPCPACDGEGTLIARRRGRPLLVRCLRCGGSGRARTCGHEECFGVHGEWDGCLYEGYDR